MSWKKFIYEGEELRSNPSSQNALALSADDKPDPRVFLAQQDVENLGDELAKEAWRAMNERFTDADEQLAEESARRAEAKYQASHYDFEEEPEDEGEYDEDLEPISITIYQAPREDSEKRLNERISSRRNGKSYSRNRRTSATRTAKKSGSTTTKSTGSRSAKASSSTVSTKKPKRTKTTQKRKTSSRSKTKFDEGRNPTQNRLEQSKQIEQGLRQLHTAPHPDAGKTVWLRKYVGSLTDHFALSGQPMTIIDWADRYFDGQDVWHVKGSLEVMDFLVRLADRPLEKGEPRRWLNNNVVIGQIGDTKVIVLESEIDKRRGFVKKGQLLDDFDEDEELEDLDDSEEEERSGRAYDPDEEQNPERFDDFDSLFDDEDEDPWE